MICLTEQDHYYYQIAHGEIYVPTLFCEARSVLRNDSLTFYIMLAAEPQSGQVGDKAGRLLWPPETSLPEAGNDLSASPSILRSDDNVLKNKQFGWQYDHNSE